jgi:hypothetical protein
MKKLRWLYLNNNNLSLIPTEIGKLSNLAYLWLNNNKIAGRLEPKMFANKDFQYLEELMLHSNQFVGGIPTEIGMLPQIRLVSLHSNALTGTIPTTLGLLSSLEVLKLHHTDLRGSVPEEVCLLVQRGSLITLTVDCSKVSCDCGCSCSNENNELALVDDTSVPATATAAGEDGGTGTPSAGPTTSPTLVAASTSAPTAEPTQTTDEPTVAAVEMEEASETPSGAIQTPPPSSEALPTAAYSTALPSAAPSFASSQQAAASTGLPTEASYNDTDEMITAPSEQAADLLLHIPDYTLEALLDTVSPQALALAWFEGDPNVAQYSLQRKLQRFGTFMVKSWSIGVLFEVPSARWLIGVRIACFFYMYSDGSDILLHQWYAMVRER